MIPNQRKRKVLIGIVLYATLSYALQKYAKRNSYLLAVNGFLDKLQADVARFSADEAPLADVVDSSSAPVAEPKREL